MSDTNSPAESPDASLVALKKELAELRSKYDTTANEKSSLEALVKQAKEDPDAALALAGLDIDELTKGVIEGKIKTRTKAEREKLKEASELENLRAKLSEVEKREKEEEQKKAIQSEIDFIREQLTEEENPLLRLLGLEPVARVKWHEKATKDGKEPDLKEIAKEIQDGILGDIKKLITHPVARKAILADKDIVAAVKEELGVSTTQAKTVLRALGAAADKGDKAKAKVAPEKPAADLTDEEKRERAIAKLLNKKR
jgi:hypothetical protein